jgi:hypothetical protein
MNINLYLLFSLALLLAAEVDDLVVFLALLLPPRDLAGAAADAIARCLDLATEIPVLGDGARDHDDSCFFVTLLGGGTSGNNIQSYSC